MNKRIAITGLGPISSLGNGVEETWGNLCAGRIGLVKETLEIGKDREYFIHKIPSFSLSCFDLNKKYLDEINYWKRNSQTLDLDYFIATISLALKDSCLEPRFLSGDVGVVLAHENAGLNEFFLNIFKESYRELQRKKISWDDYLQRMFQYGSRPAYDLQTFMFLFHVTKLFEIHGFSLFLNNACASGLFALEAAADVIRTKKCKAVIVAAVDSPDFFKFLWFDSLKLYSADGVARPFSKHSNGLVFGHGGTAIVLEDLDFAKKRHAKIYAEYLGGDFCLESWKVAYPNISEKNYENVIRGAIRKCGTKATEIGVINLHGVGNGAIDKYEGKAIMNVFGDLIKQPPVIALKPYCGHTLGGSALLESAISLMSLEKGVFHPVLNTEKKDLVCPLNLLFEKKKFSPEYFLKTCTAFAGFNAAVIFKQVG